MYKRKDINPHFEVAKKTRVPFRWVCGYMQSLSQKADLSLKACVNFGFENGQLRQAQLHIRWFKENKPTPDGLRFNLREVEFLKNNLPRLLKSGDGIQYFSRNGKLAMKNEDGIIKASFGNSRYMKFVRLTTVDIVKLVEIMPMIKDLMDIRSSREEILSEILAWSVFRVHNGYGRPVLKTVPDELFDWIRSKLEDEWDVLYPLVKSCALGFGITSSWVDARFNAAAVSAFIEDNFSKKCHDSAKHFEFVANNNEL
jgi:hypothetical protein